MTPFGHHVVGRALTGPEKVNAILASVDTYRPKMDHVIWITSVVARNLYPRERTKPILSDEGEAGFAFPDSSISDAARTSVEGAD